MIRYVEETGSTNFDLVDRLKRGEYLPEGDWLVSDRQSQGRGRLGRDWFDGSGNFMGSTVVHWGPGQPAPSTLAFVVALAVHEAVGGFLPSRDGLVIKWPNDLLLKGAKLAGVLLEMIQGRVVVGVGVNLCSAPNLPDKPATSLRDLGVTVDRNVFAERLQEAFALELERWRGAGLAPVLRRWQTAAHPEGTALRVHPPGEEPVSGRFAGLSPEGSLRLRCADEMVREIHAGDVFLPDIPG
ncbi:biotin--[acetyl-CoA-carboxylase] ligase [Novosphingobium mangrovi (ex Hu et al. 2023)]|uniref:biotin--[biotin carboxyl-carrier protein] ligase n=1 Tax=Novosphingobium mangrovi (ex Hu et al. 2023) TaxID=2930094 RepID=A0ABT0AAC5_9SPHN|nr:biotin--[acetyl-CoA-carboxylase] ligase [Novosphingobium mangrovi (ex Hu et al. 2023)]MCJ1960153.1 biotin--[acetyl-CoA-carboxylase] ligase [Novosphingobium mangrovi (ex Hu et al. 2023)]